MQKKEPNVNKLKLIWRFLKGSKGLFVLSMLMAALTALSDMITPQIILAAVDNAIGKKPSQFAPWVMKIVDSVGGFEYLGKNLWIMALAILAVALGIAAGHWLPGIVPVNAVLGGALSYLILNPILNRKTTAAMTHVEVNSVE